MRARACVCACARVVWGWVQGCWEARAYARTHQSKATAMGVCDAGYPATLPKHTNSVGTAAWHCLELPVHGLPVGRGAVLPHVATHHGLVEDLAVAEHEHRVLVLLARRAHGGLEVVVPIRHAVGAADLNGVKLRRSGVRESGAHWYVRHGRMQAAIIAVARRRHTACNTGVFISTTRIAKSSMKYHAVNTKHKTLDPWIIPWHHPLGSSRADTPPVGSPLPPLSRGSPR